MTQGVVREVLQQASVVGHDPFILHATQNGPWASFKRNWASLIMCIEKVATSLEADAARTAARRAAPPLTGLVLPWCDGLESSLKPAARSGHAAALFASLNAAVQLVSPYVPVSTTFYEPDERTARWRYFESLALTSDVVLVSKNVGGHIGVLNWVFALRPGAPPGEDNAEISCAMTMIAKLAPDHHARAQRNAIMSKIQSVATVSAAAARAIYMEITGDETLPESREEKQRVAAVAHVFAAGIGDVKFIPDLRALANTANKLGKTCFEPFWGEVHEPPTNGGTALGSRTRRTSSRTTPCTRRSARFSSPSRMPARLTPTHASRASGTWSTSSCP